MLTLASKLASDTDILNEVLNFATWLFSVGVQRIWDPLSCDGAIFVMFASWHVDQGEEPAVAPIRVQGAEQRNKRSRHTCDLCDKLIIGDLEWTGEGLVES